MRNAKEGPPVVLHASDEVSELRCPADAAGRSKACKRSGLQACFDCGYDQGLTDGFHEGLADREPDELRG